MKQDANHRPTLNLRDVRRRSDIAAASFDSADFVHTVTRDGLFERLQPLVIEATRVLDLGAATGRASARLKKRFRAAHLVSLDVSRNMLLRARSNRAWLSRSHSSFVQADASQLPFDDQSIDVVFSNQLLPFLGAPGRVFQEVSRVLRKGGVFAFATLGPDSLLELRRAWSRVDSDDHVHHFLDMHDIGDALLRSGLRDPVLDVDHLEIHYENSERLFADLGNVGARNTLRERSRSLMGKRRFEKMRAALASESADGGVRLHLELVYGHCWGGGPRMDPANYTVDASRIPHRRG
ncbi:MAG: class I SAM-dependent methyltransferase [Woeseiaceae bacterium]